MKNYEIISIVYVVMRYNCNEYTSTVSKIFKEKEDALEYIREKEVSI